MKKMLITALCAAALTGACGTGAAKQKNAEDDKNKNPQSSVVYMTRRITAEALIEIYRKLERPAQGRVAIKLHMGEPGNTNYLSADLVRDLVLEVDGTLIDANTYYGGRRTNAEDHIQAAVEHGYSFAPIDILDADGEISLPVVGGRLLTEAIIGSHYGNYDFIVSIAHFKGHAMAGFGGTFKNLAVGMASVNGKRAIHAEPGGGMWSSTGESFLGKVAEYNKAIMDDMGERMLYINVLNNLSVDCDCDANAAHPQMADIGILASLDPVALDRASVDLIYAAPENERRHLVERIESRNGTYVIDYAQELGLGTQDYELIVIDN